MACARYRRRSRGSGVTSAARRMSRPPSPSTSANASSLRTRRSASLQIHRWSGRRARSTCPPNESRILTDVSIFSVAVKTGRYVMAELILGLVGVSLIAAAIAANQRWLDRHFLPSFVVSRAWYLRIEIALRVVIAGVGVTLLLIARRRIARTLVDARGQMLRIAIAVALALVAGEAVLRRVNLRPAEWLLPAEEPRRQSDAVLG